jgi:transposase
VPRPHSRYPDEFREKAVQLVRSTDESIPKIADELGISHQTLRNCHQADVDSGKRDGLTTEERDELRELRRKVKRLAVERDILGKATAFFSNRGDETR